MALLRIPFFVALVLVLIAAGMTSALARHQARAVGEMALCTGAGMLTVQVDAQGRPTGPALPCPDCLPPMAALAGAGGALPGPALDLVPAAHALRDLPGAPVAPLVHHAPRGPPASV